MHLSSASIACNSLMLARHTYARWQRVVSAALLSPPHPSLLSPHKALLSPHPALLSPHPALLQVGDSSVAKNSLAAASTTLCAGTRASVCRRLLSSAHATSMLRKKSQEYLSNQNCPRLSIAAAAAGRGFLAAADGRLRANCGACTRGALKNWEIAVEVD